MSCCTLDPELAVKWPTETPQFSARDAAAPSLAEPPAWTREASETVAPDLSAAEGGVGSATALTAAIPRWGDDSTDVVHWGDDATTALPRSRHCTRVCSMRSQNSATGLRRSRFIRPKFISKVRRTNAAMISGNGPWKPW